MDTKIKFPEYRYVEIAVGSYSCRNTVIELSQINSHLAKNPNKPAWTSHFRSTIDFKTYTENNLIPVLDKDKDKKRQSVTGYAGPGYSDFLWLDIDVRAETTEARKEALTCALAKAKTLLGRMLHEYELDADYFTCYFSGSKGFHIGIPIEAFQVEPCADFHAKCKYLAIAIAGDLGIDESLYDRTRLFRIPNTPNDVSGLYKIELSADEIFACKDIQVIIDKAKQSREYKGTRLDADEIVGCLSHLLDGYQQSRVRVADETTERRTKGHDYARILGGKLEGTSRTENLVILSGHWYSKGISLPEAVQIGKAWDQNNSLGLDADPKHKGQYPVGKVAGTIEDIYIRNDRQGGRREKITEEYKSAAELEKKVFEPIKWIVPGFIPEGLTLFPGKAKLGKSWLMLNCGLAVSSGGKFLNAINTERGAVLYLDLDGNERRLKRRLEKIMCGEPFPQDLIYRHRYERGLEGIDKIDTWLQERGDARLVIIDTFVKFRELSTGKNVDIYEKDTTELDSLQKLAEKYHIAIVLVHHLRKMGSEDNFDTVLGSTGMTSGVDTVAIMKKEGRTRSDAILIVDGKDIEEPSESAIEFDRNTGIWKLLGKADDYRQSVERQEIIDTLTKSKEPMSPKQISDVLGKPYNNINKLMFIMLNGGEIYKHSYGKYVIGNSGNSGNGGNSGNSGNSSKQSGEEELPMTYGR